MDSRIFYRLLALDRCRQSLAQLCAAVHLIEQDSSRLSGDFSEMAVSLIEGLNRDLDFIGKSLEDPVYIEQNDLDAGAKILDFFQDQ